MDSGNKIVKKVGSLAARFFGRETVTNPVQDNSNIVDEHFVPTLGLELNSYLESGDVAGVHHLIRPLWALKLLSDSQPVESVIDVACGAGYGSYLYAKNFPSAQILGIDYDQTGVEYARAHYSLPNLEFRIGDVTRWDETIGSDVFDCVTSFDTIEHVVHREIMMENLVNHLNEDGCLLFSTPCGWDTPQLTPDWEHHKIEYSAASLYDFLRRYFKTVLRPEDGDFPHLEMFTHANERGIGYLLRLNPVVCRGPIHIENPYK